MFQGTNSFSKGMGLEGLCSRIHSRGGGIIFKVKETGMEWGRCKLSWWHRWVSSSTGDVNRRSSVSSNQLNSSCVHWYHQLNDWRQKGKRAAEDEMVEWHHWLNGHEFEQTLGDSEGQGSLAFCRPWGRKESDTMEWLDNNSEPWIVLMLSTYFSLNLHNKCLWGMKTTVIQ